MKTFIQTAKFEHEFWLQILGDHSRFILDSLSVSEDKYIREADYFKHVFDRLLQNARSLNDESSLITLASEAVPQVEKLKQFKLLLIERHLVGKVKIHLSPTFLSHMVNELEEYERLLQYLQKGEKPPIYHELHHHLLWLQDAFGHAGAIHSEMDATEHKLKLESKEFVKQFQQFYLKAVVFTGYLRTSLDTFPALKKMNQDVKLEMEMFQIFLKEIFELEISNQVLSTFPVLMADHMFREECYYLIKLAETANTEIPNCNPAKPRSE
ncbi:DUF2935 domain-containing protein [Bacillus sp. FJAT-49736]|uniref:DUF2935 domain-containing protein n=1 Tax=Bacillus sp. FJAT-49736 TaxID=2833582 RepID=UPI001BC99868|nr:DUF2935 domain-containing protein [Bacillus sp. FJAT-49736]